MEENLSNESEVPHPQKLRFIRMKTPLFVESIEHSQDELKPFENIIDQYEMRKDLILATMEKNGVHKEDLTAIVSRGGFAPSYQGRCLPCKRRYGMAAYIRTAE